MHNHSIQARSYAGLAAGPIAYFILGMSSLFWKLLAAVPAPVLLGYRVLISLATLALALVVLGRIRQVLTLATDRRVVAVHSCAAVLVAANWLTFIWGSIHGRVLETGIGYLLAPAVMILTGAVVLRERLRLVQVIAVMMCVCGVTLLVTTSSELDPWVYLTIGLTWGLYGTLKKITKAGPIDGLTIETVVLSVLVVLATLAFPYSLSISGRGGWFEIALLATCGVVSVTPLYLLAYSAQKVSLGAAGFVQYVLPTTQLLVAVMFYRQYPSISTVLGFVIIWSALVMVLGESVLRRSRARSSVGGQQ